MGLSCTVDSTHLTLRDDALLFVEPVVTTRHGMPLLVPLVAKHEASPDGVGVPF
jgi:hypothetical protein